MQRAFTDPSLSLPHLLYLAIAGFIGYFARKGHNWLGVWLNRNKPAAEIHETQARADKTMAEAAEIRADTLERWLTRVDQMRTKVDALSEERDGLRLKNQLLTIELRMHENDIKKMKGIMDAKGIKLSDFDEPKQ